jgi:integrase
MDKPHKLTDTLINSTKAAPEPVKLTDGGGLFLLINPNGSRLWRYRYRINGKENVFALGEYGKGPNGEASEAKALRVASGILTLSEAREAHAKAKMLVKSGQHPSAVRAESRRVARVARATTFEGVAREWLTRASVKWKPETLRQRERLLEADIFPVIGKRPIAELKRYDLNNLILSVESRAPQMAVLARQLLQGIFDHAENIGAVVESIALRLTKVETLKVTHARQLKVEEIGPFLRACDAYQGSFEVRTAMRLAWLTLSRTMEVLAAEWAEFDLDQGVWRIPESRMKMERDHIVPLSTQANELLVGLQAATGKGKFLFPNKVDRSRPISKGVLWKMTDSIGWRGCISPHGLRGTAYTIMQESGRWSETALDRLLAHAEENKTRGSYDAAEFLVQREEALQWWADLLDALIEGKDGAVVHYLPKFRQVS